MSIERIKNTSLWKTSLSEDISDQFKQEREKLRSALLVFRDNVSILTSRIAADLPNLTQHDISHLDALWETASLICGDSYALNPMEAFILGGAFLLHDSALCFEAYSNGKDGIRKTIEWHDAFESIKDRNKEISIEEASNMADFDALRVLHSHQAEKLAEMSWKDHSTNQDVYLIENYELRKHLAKSIGKIAASHHWNIEDINLRLSAQINALPGFPKDWRINEIKLACILRCADAAHIDSERAPDFLHALIRRRGISFAHWSAQNRLAQADIDQDDPDKSTLRFTSTRNFTEEDSDAWWVAYDAACLIDKELRESNLILAKRNLSFQVNGVKGVDTPEEMSKYIVTEGWTPCNAQIHVSNIEKLVSNLGGEKLYGSGCDKLEIALREIIQNSRDSINARKFYAKESNYKGKIVIRKETKGTDIFFTVEDNGIGMSKRVLTGPLLDFGTSFWKSTLVQHEFPGLRSSKFKSIGQFGIGFYSVFMCADDVTVSSKQWNAGTSEVLQLHFKNGLSLRPLLKKSTSGFPIDISTRTCFRLLDPEVLNKSLNIKSNYAGSKGFTVSLQEFISAICSGIEVNVFFSNENSAEELIHNEKLDSSNSLQWLEMISFSTYQAQEEQDYLVKNYSRLRPIEENNVRLGYAAISTFPSNRDRFMGVKTIGGLSANIRGLSQDFIGYIDYTPRSAQRSILNFTASPEAILAWAEEQVKIIDYTKLPPVERYFFTSNVYNFGIDPIDIGIIPVNVNEELRVFTFKDLAKISINNTIAIIKSGLMDHIDCHHRIQKVDGMVLIYPLRNSNFLTLEMENGRPKNPNSLIGCLYRAIQQEGYTPEFDIENEKFDSDLGKLDLLKVRSIKI